MKKHIIKLGKLGLATTVLVPLLASAQGGFLDTLGGLTVQFRRILDLLVPIVFTMGILAFFYGIFLYVFSQGADEKINGRHIMLWSLVAIFVMASLFGIIQLAQNTLNIRSGAGEFPTPRAI